MKKGVCKVALEKVRCPSCNAVLPKLWQEKMKVGNLEELRKNLDSYRDFIHEERLDGNAEICRYLGVSSSVFSGRIKAKMDEANILFQRESGRSGRKIKSAYFTYKRLVLIWLMQNKVI